LYYPSATASSALTPEAERDYLFRKAEGYCKLQNCHAAFYSTIGIKCKTAQSPISVFCNKENPQNNSMDLSLN